MKSNVVLHLAIVCCFIAPLSAIKANSTASKSVSYVKGDYRIIAYANNLNTNGTLAQYNNAVSA